MPVYQVRWEQPAAVTATVTIDLDELAQWAVEVAGARTLDSGRPGEADVDGLRRTLEHNPRLREHLLQLWAADRLSRRDYVGLSG